MASLIGSFLPSPADQVAQPLFAAWVIALAYVWRPSPALAAWLLLTLFANTWAHYQGDAVLHLDEAVLPMLFLLALVRHAVPERRIEIGFREGALAVFVAAGLASSLLNQVPPSVFGAALVLVLKAVAVYYLVSWTRPSVDEIQQAGTVVLGVAAVTLVLSLVEALNPSAFRAVFGLPTVVSQRGGTDIVTSLFVQAGLFAWFTSFCSLFIYAFALIYRRWWMFAAALLLNVGTILSGRRRQLVGVVVAFLVALAWLWRGSTSLRHVLRTALPLVASLVVLIAISVPLFGSFYASTFERYMPQPGVIRELAFGDGELTKDQARSVQPRVALYAASVAIARDHFPLGVGLGRYGSPMSRVTYSPVYAQYGLASIYGLRQQDPEAITDTFWPMLLGETGVLGATAYAAFIGALVVGAWRVGHAATARVSRALALGVLMVLVLGLVESLVAPTFQAPPVAYFLFAAAGLLPSLTDSEQA